VKLSIKPLLSKSLSKLSSLNLLQSLWLKLPENASTIQLSSMKEKKSPRRKNVSSLSQSFQFRKRRQLRKEKRLKSLKLRRKSTPEAKNDRESVRLLQKPRKKTLTRLWTNLVKEELPA
jgi:hypothetical protein